MKRSAPALEGFLFGSDDEGSTCSGSPKVKKDPNGPAWHDSDDEALEVDISSKRRLRKLRKKEDDEIVSGKEYEKRLRERFVKMHGAAATKWAEAAQETDSESEAEIFQTSSKMVLEAKGGQIAPTRLQIRRQTDVTKTKKGNAVTQAVKFHPDGEIVMTCGYDKTLRLYHIDNDQNPVVGSYHFPNFPLSGGVFTSDGNSCVLTGLASSVWRFDVESGQARKIVLGGRSFEKIHSIVQGGDGFLGLGADNGNACIVDEKTNRIIKTVKMNSETRGIAFHHTKRVVYTADKEAYLYEWDLGTGRCITRFRDEATVSCSSLALSPDGKRLAVGTQSGVVDFFDTTGPTLSDNIINSVDNLHTQVTSMCFHPSSDVLALASKYEKTAMKLVHVPSYTVYANWPTQKTPLRRPMCLDFSRQGGQLAVGNENGKVVLFTLEHYQ